MMTPVELRSVIGKRKKREEEKVRLQELWVYLSTHLPLVLDTCDLLRIPCVWASIEKEHPVLAFKNVTLKGMSQMVGKGAQVMGSFAIVPDKFYLSVEAMYEDTARIVGKKWLS